MKINLLPWRHRAARKSLYLLMMWFFAAILVIVVVAFSLKFQILQKARRAQASNAQLQARATSLMQDTEYQSQQHKYTSARKNLAFLLDRHNQQMVLIHVLQSIGAALPAQIFLTELIYKEGRLYLRGQANNSKQVAMLTQHLKRQKNLAGVRVNKIENQTTESSSHGTTFSLQATVHSGRK